jgi:hypothetical protein
MLKRSQVETLIGRRLSNTEWRETSNLLKSVERHSNADAILDRCLEQGATIEALIDELAKPSPSTR